MTDKPKMTIEDLMKLRTKTGEHHLDPANFDFLLDEMIVLKQKLAEKEDLIEGLQADAMSDPLTGLANRRTFEQEMERSFSTARRYERTHGLLLIDVNNFKSVNDRLGHVVGDRVLCHVARLLRQNIRSTDIAARLGGDEFCVILNELHAHSHAETRAKAISDIISQTPCLAGEHTLHVSVSVGHYVFTFDEELEDVLQRADESMYAQKVRFQREVD